MRPSWDVYFMAIAKTVATRSTCDRRHVGCVIVNRNNQIVTTGYNGSSPGAPHCDDVGHLMHNNRCVRTIHAEANAIAQAAKFGQSVNGGIAYVTTRPCQTCLMLMASAGIAEVRFLEPYHSQEDSITTILADAAGVKLTELVE